MGQVAVGERELEVAIKNLSGQVALEDTSDKQHRYQARRYREVCAQSAHGHGAALTAQSGIADEFVGQVRTELVKRLFEQARVPANRVCCVCGKDEHAQRVAICF